MSLQFYFLCSQVALAVLALFVMTAKERERDL